MRQENLDPLLDEDQGVEAVLDKVSSKTQRKYSQLLVHLEGGYTLSFFLNDDQSNLVKMLTAPKK